MHWRVYRRYNTLSLYPYETTTTTLPLSNLLYSSIMSVSSLQRRRLLHAPRLQHICMCVYVCRYPMYKYIGSFFQIKSRNSLGVNTNAGTRHVHVFESKAAFAQHTQMLSFAISKRRTCPRCVNSSILIVSSPAIETNRVPRIYRTLLKNSPTFRRE